MNKLKLYYPLYPWTLNQSFGGNFIIDYTKICSGGQCLKGHNGLDAVRGFHNNHYYEINGANVRAAHKGMIVYAGMDGAEGVGVVLRTLEPYDYNGQPVYFKTIYWHLVNNIPVKVGQIVNVGDIIGTADNTGMSTGTHLHFGLKPQAQGENEWTWANIEQNNGYFGAIDPLPYFVGYSAYEYKVGLIPAKILLKLKLGN